jgi:hypothetical protein
LNERRSRARERPLAGPEQKGRRAAETVNPELPRQKMHELGISFSTGQAF